VTGRSPERSSDAAHYFSAEPAVSSRPKTVALDLPGMHLDLATDAGVFSGDRVDAGTKLLLLDGPSTPAGATVLDLGCGYGPIAVALARRTPPDVTVWAVDVNRRALDLCRDNAAAADVGDRVHTAVPDDLPTELRFDQIWSNPPIRVGKPALHALLLDALTRLADHGTAHLVVQKHLGADSLARWLTDGGWPTRRTVSRAGYRLLEVRRG
jgi:16S rRNA (guanine1207-N2)-methyltransferase